MIFVTPKFLFNCPYCLLVLERVPTNDISFLKRSSSSWCLHGMIHAQCGSFRRAENYHFEHLFLLVPVCTWAINLSFELKWNQRQPLLISCVTVSFSHSIYSSLWIHVFLIGCITIEYRHIGFKFNALSWQCIQVNAILLFFFRAYSSLDLCQCADFRLMPPVHWLNLSILYTIYPRVNIYTIPMLTLT